MSGNPASPGGPSLFLPRSLSPFSAPHSTSQTPSVHTPLKLDFNFGAAPIDAPPSVVLLALRNSGLVPLDWYGWPGGVAAGLGGRRWRPSLLMVARCLVPARGKAGTPGMGCGGQGGTGSSSSTQHLSLAETRH